MKHLLLLFVCFNLNAQLNIAGAEYVLLDDMGITDLRTPRTETERFPNLNWDAINKEDLTTIVEAFVRDAVTHGARLDLADRHILRIRPSSYWSDPRIGGTSYNSTSPGYDININRAQWNSIPTGIGKIQLIYHELGHGLLHAGHVCERTTVGNRNYYAVMSTATCLTGNGGPGLSVSSYNLALITEWIDHLFDTLIILPNSQAARGPSVIHN